MNRSLLALSALVCVACGEGPAKLQSKAAARATAAATADFAFLPPLAAAPALAGAVDASLTPEVRITDDSGAVVARYTTAGEGAARLRVDPGCNCWTVNWPASGSGARRIHVAQGGVELGAIDVFLATPKTRAPAGFVALNSGRTVPIKFFADACAGVVCAASDQCHVAGACDLATGACSNPAAPDGTQCDDGNGCTRDDACSAGACGGSGCAEDAACNGSGPSAQCICSVGFAGNGFSCADIDECQFDNGGCDPLTTCANTPGSFTCGACPAGYLGTGATGCTPACAGGQSYCGGGCVDTSSNAQNCGACGNACGAGSACMDSLCCAGSAAKVCDGACTNLDSDVNNCGGCGIRCSADQACTASGCVDVCTFGPQPQGLAAIEIEPTAGNLIAGVNAAQAFRVLGYDRATPWQRVDVTSRATFASDSAAVAVDSAGNVTLAAGAQPGMAHLTATVDGLQLTANVRVWDPARYGAIQSLAIDIGDGFSTFGTAIGNCYGIHLDATYADGTTEDVTSSAAWHNGDWYAEQADALCERVIGQDLLDITGCPQQNPDVGWYTKLFGALVPGSALQAPYVVSYVGGKGQCSDARVPGAPLAVWTTPQQISLAVGEARQFGAWALYSDQSMRQVTNQVSFRTCDPASADMAPDGWATALAVGQSEVAAQFGALAGVSTLSMSATPDLGAPQTMHLDPSAANVPGGAAYRLKAFATYANTGPSRFFNVSRQTAWTSNDGAFMPDPFNGFGIAGAAPGRATVNAAFAGFSASGSVRAWDAARLASITSLSPSWNVFLGQGQCEQLRAIATFNGNPADTEDETQDATWTRVDTCFGSLTSAGYFWASGPFCVGYDYLPIKATMGFGLPFATGVIGAGPGTDASGNPLPNSYRDPASCGP